MRDSPPDDPFAFEPVPSASNRHDGWTPERQRLFIAALRRVGIVAWAAEAAGMSRKSAYALLKRAGPDSGFARAWAEAQAEGQTGVLFTTIERAMKGVEQPYFYGGLQRGTRRVYDDRLLLAAFRTIQRMQGAR
ncbi:MAG: hypothetical protein JO013_13910 [Alphaproteobacteria bacterium]|nr:hypothetical protein [Alphaproteobacteria bacterium]